MSKERSVIGTWWKRKTLSAKIGFIIAAGLLLSCIIGLFIYIYARPIFGDEIADRVLGVGVSSGWELAGKAFADGAGKWGITFIIIAIAIVVIFVGNFVTHLFDGVSRKAKTIASLLRSLIKYVAIITALCFILVVWGVDVLGIIAGVGVLTLIIGLGCQSLIQDIVSGLFIVFDDHFAVGDMVIIDGFRGEVIEVGLKTTKLVDFGGNIKAITNSSINTVVNLSRLRSVCSVTLSISYNEDIKRVEALIINKIAELRKEIPNISDGPYYKGIDNLTASGVDLLVIAFTMESHRFQVTRDLKREFYLLFKENDIQIPYTQVTINQEDPKDRIKATKEEIAIAVAEQNKIRGIRPEGETQAKKKGLNLRKKVEESYKKSIDELDLK